jgi:membrane protease YdiL (CAAX protease family)
MTPVSQGSNSLELPAGGNSAASASLRSASTPRSSVQVAGLVGLWMLAGWTLRLSADAYLLLGIPLTAFFQLVLRRAPLRGLWVREAPPFRLGWKGMALALGLAALPVALFALFVVQRNWIKAAWTLCAVAGSFAAAYALLQFRRETWRPLLACLLSAGGLGSAYMTLMTWLSVGKLVPRPGGGIVSLVLFFPVCFLLEEVTFRGALDTHLYLSGTKAGLMSAVFVSSLWGLWYLPLLSDFTMACVVVIVFAHGMIGVPLSLYWRRTGNLAVPALAHALIGAVRDALQAGAGN